MRDDCQSDGMKVLAAVIACMVLLIPCACAQSLDEGLIHTVEELDIASIEQASGQENIGMILLRLAKGDKVWDAQEMLDKALDILLGEVRRSMGRMTLLMAPSIACGVAGLLAQRNKSVAEMVQSVCFLTLATLIMADAQVYLRESEEAVVRMASLMEALFPVLMTLLSAVGATSGAALFKPAIAAASGTMTALVRNVSLRLSVGVAVVTLLDHLSPRMQLSRLSKLLRMVCTWTLGIAFTVFIGVTALQGLTASVADGVSIRAAKYAVDNFVPVVGGMFADTMDTLVGCAMMIKNALGVTGMVLLFSVAGMPMVRTLCAAMVYRLCAALLQPAAQERAADMLHAFSEVLMLMFIIQLSVGAMFVLLIAQVLAVGGVTMGLR